MKIYRFAMLFALISLLFTGGVFGSCLRSSPVPAIVPLVFAVLHHEQAEISRAPFVACLRPIPWRYVACLQAREFSRRCDSRGYFGAFA